MAEYQPGVCNIGRDEQRTRRLGGVVSLVAALGVVGFVLASGRPDSLLLVSFPLFFGAAVGFVQARMRFCAAFGALARYDLSGSGGESGTGEDREAVRRDRRKAATVLAYAAGLAAIATAIVYSVGTLV